MTYDFITEEEHGQWPEAVMAFARWDTGQTVFAPLPTRLTWVAFLSGWQSHAKKALQFSTPANEPPV